MQPSAKTLKAHLLSAFILTAPLIVGGTIAWAQSSDGNEAFEAYLVDAVPNAAQHTAVIEVKVPAGQRHIHHQIDGGVVVDTTQTRLTFRNLHPGEHTFAISLPGQQPSGATRALKLTVP